MTSATPIASMKDTISIHRFFIWKQPAGLRIRYPNVSGEGDWWQSSNKLAGVSSGSYGEVRNLTTGNTVTEILAYTRDLKWNKKKDSHGWVNKGVGRRMCEMNSKVDLYLLVPLRSWNKLNWWIFHNKFKRLQKCVVDSIDCLVINRIACRIDFG